MFKHVALGFVYGEPTVAVCQIQIITNTLNMLTVNIWAKPYKRPGADAAENVSLGNYSR